VALSRLVTAVVRAARAAEAAAISALALRSKAHWGYDPAFLEACRDDLTIRPEWCDGLRLVVAEQDGVLLGYARVAGEPPVGELAGLFVDPAAIGHGVGGLLLRHAVRIAAGLGMTALEIESDPNAEPFYRHAGAVRTGESASTVDPTRLLPRLELAVPA
jgi:GNAT superfamily N-acetyltransferase